MSRPQNALASVLLVMALVLAGCSPKAVPQKSEDELLDFSDDLSRYRPVVESVGDRAEKEENAIIRNDSIESRYDISDKLNVLLDTIRQRNFDKGELEGFTILVYSGTNETEAGRVRNSLYDIVPGLEARVKYTLPTYFVKIGRFYQQIEAQPLYLKIREFYPDATVVPEKFPIE